MCQRILVVAMLGLLAARCNGEQRPLEKAFPDVSVLGAQKGFHSHLQRMLQTSTPAESEPVRQICSPAARRDGACISPDPEIPLPEPVKKESLASQTCSGSECKVNAASTNPEPRAPQTKTVTFGPMTHDSYERMVQKRRATLKAKLQEAGELSLGLEAFLSAADRPAADRPTDLSDIPMPAPRSVPSASSPVDTPSSSSSKGNTDFEMRFEPQTPSPDPHYYHASVAAESPAPAPIRTTITTTTTSSSPAVPDVVAESPAPQPTTTTTNASASSFSVTGAGPARPPVTENDAAAARNDAQRVAREASLARKREYVAEQSQSQQLLKGKKRSGSTTATAPQSPTPTTLSALRAAQQKKDRQQGNKAAARAARSEQQQPQHPAAAVVPQAVSSAAAMRWDLLDYVCTVSLVVAVGVALFVAVAVVEDLTAVRRMGRPQGMPLVFHWLALSRGLFRRCCRAFHLARKHLVGHASDLPLSVQEIDHVSPLARAIAPLTSTARVFWNALRASQSGRSRASSSGGSGGLMVDVSASPFAAAAVGYSVDNSAAATATAELQLRRRH